LLNPDSWTLVQGLLVFAGCALVIALAGTRITGVVDQLADRTGIGEAAAGAVLLGFSTSIGGSVLSVTAAWNGNAELAVSNALGGIAVQTFFLAVADMVYRRANLEHAAASVPNMIQNALLIMLLALIMMTPLLPEVTFWQVHFATPLLFIKPGKPVQTSQTTQVVCRRRCVCGLSSRCYLWCLVWRGGHLSRRRL